MSKQITFVMAEMVRCASYLLKKQPLSEADWYAAARLLSLALRLGPRSSWPKEYYEATLRLNDADFDSTKRLFYPNPTLDAVIAEVEKGLKEE